MPAPKPGLYCPQLQDEVSALLGHGQANPKLLVHLLPGSDDEFDGLVLARSCHILGVSSIVVRERGVTEVPPSVDRPVCLKKVIRIPLHDVHPKPVIMPEDSVYLPCVNPIHHRSFLDRPDGLEDHLNDLGGILHWFLD